MSNNFHGPDDLDRMSATRGQPGDSSPAGETFVHDEGPIVDEHEFASAHGRGEGVGEAKEVQGLSQGQIVWRRFRRHLGAIFGVCTLAIISLVSLLTMGLDLKPGGGKFNGFYHHQDPNEIFNVVNGGTPTMQFPSWLGGSAGSWFIFGEFPFGQDEIGYDNFAQVMAGIQTSLMVMIVMGIIVLLVGVTVGSLAGYYRGWVDNLLMRLTDTVITLPVIVIGAVLGKLVYTLPEKLNAAPWIERFIRDWMPVELAIALGLILWPTMARLLRAEFLSLREREFVDSARVAGASNFRIITKHMLPNAMGIIIVNITLLMSTAVVLETALSYLGFGIQSPAISLGRLISANQGAFSTRPWLFWWPGLFIILIALSVNFIGDGLRDAFDPRTKRIPSQGKMDRAFAEREKRAAAANTTPAVESTGAGA
ncbi:ABC transporter permease [Propionibacteriaceae bacterium G1746]|uniref:ABC transporter permease n=1 Tax=Aestuariimicrobium sp. G57 TaxID=3418485 RepID=UPI003C242E73